MIVVTFHVTGKKTRRKKIMRITRRWYKALLDRIKCLETESERKSKIIEHLIKENEMLATTSVQIKKDQFSHNKK